VVFAGEVVEEGPTAEVLARRRHTYTEGLLRVASLGDWERRQLEIIPGRPPEAGQAPPGCRFADRCAYAADACRETAVPLSSNARCLRAGELVLQGVR
jgi:peptide/nickel transport system ATP-binding protein